MKTVSTLLHLAALMACFATHQAFSDNMQMPGVRRAVEAAAGKNKPSTVVPRATVISCPDA